MKYLLSPDELPAFQSGQAGISARVLNGAEHGLPSLSLILNETAPDDGAPPHWHGYDEIFVLQEGRCVFMIGDESVQAAAGQIVLAPANVPHSFRNPGPEPLRMIAIHAADRVRFERLDGKSAIATA